MCFLRISIYCKTFIYINVYRHYLAEDKVKGGSILPFLKLLLNRSSYLKFPDNFYKFKFHLVQKEKK